MTHVQRALSRYPQYIACHYGCFRSPLESKQGAQQAESADHFVTGEAGRDRDGGKQRAFQHGPDTLSGDARVHLKDVPFCRAAAAIAMP